MLLEVLTEKEIRRLVRNEIKALVPILLEQTLFKYGLFEIDPGKIRLAESDSITELCLKPRARNSLNRFCPEVQTIEDLLKLSPSDLLRLRNFGRVSLLELEKELAKHGFALRT